MSDGPCVDSVLAERPKILLASSQSTQLQRNLAASPATAKVVKTKKSRFFSTKNGQDLESSKTLAKRSAVWRQNCRWICPQPASFISSKASCPHQGIFCQAAAAMKSGFGPPVVTFWYHQSCQNLAQHTRRNLEDKKQLESQGLANQSQAWAR